MRASMRCGTVRFALRNGAFCTAERCILHCGTVRFALRNGAFCTAERCVLHCGTVHFALRHGPDGKPKADFSMCFLCFLPKQAILFYTFHWLLFRPDDRSKLNILQTFDTNTAIFVHDSLVVLAFCYFCKLKVDSVWHLTLSMDNRNQRTKEY